LACDTSGSVQLSEPGATPGYRRSLGRAVCADALAIEAPMITEAASGGNRLPRINLAAPLDKVMAPRASLSTVIT
jgi:hypothetical protein